MNSFLNASLPVLMQANRSEGGTLLPWPTGSLLAGRLEPASDGAGAMLMLANYRVRVEVPPNVPMGKVWLQLLQREKPGQFRLLSEQQATAFITNLFNHQQKALTDKPAIIEHALKQDWQKLPLELIPFLTEQQEQRLLLLDAEHQPQGFVQAEAGKDEFMLYGRLDLEHLGVLLFSLVGEEGKPFKVVLYVQDKAKHPQLTQAFNDWLSEQQVYPRLEGNVHEGQGNDVFSGMLYRA